MWGFLSDEKIIYNLFLAAHQTFVDVFFYLFISIYIHYFCANSYSVTWKKSGAFFFSCVRGSHTAKKNPTIKPCHANHKQTLHMPPKSGQNKHSHTWISLHLKRVFTGATIWLNPCNGDSNMVLANDAELEEQAKQVELHLIQQESTWFTGSYSYFLSEPGREYWVGMEKY